MTARQIKRRTYWNFIKLTHRWPRKPERRIISTIAAMSEEMFEGLFKEPTPLVPDDSYLDGINYWHLGGKPEPVSEQEAEATLCGCGHGDYRTCPCEDTWPEDD